MGNDGESQRGPARGPTRSRTDHLPRWTAWRPLGCPALLGMPAKSVGRRVYATRSACAGRLWNLSLQLALHAFRAPRTPTAWSNGTANAARVHRVIRSACLCCCVPPSATAAIGQSPGVGRGPHTREAAERAQPTGVSPGCCK